MKKLKEIGVYELLFNDTLDKPVIQLKNKETQSIDWISPLYEMKENESEIEKDVLDHDHDHDHDHGEGEEHTHKKKKFKWSWVEENVDPKLAKQFLKQAESKAEELTSVSKKASRAKEINTEVLKELV